MKTCQFCNRQIPDDANLCPYCGRRVVEPNFNRSQQQYNNTNPNDEGGCGWTALGFFFPVVGLILYLIWQTEKPLTARAAGKGALISVIIDILLIPAGLYMILLLGGGFWGYQIIFETIDIISIQSIL